VVQLQFGLEKYTPKEYCFSNFIWIINTVLGFDKLTSASKTHYSRSSSGTSISNLKKLAFVKSELVFDGRILSPGTISEYDISLPTYSTT
jgi:hypothetical protein